MIRISICTLAPLASLCISLAALAQTPAEQAVEFCEARYPGSDSNARLKQVLCIQDQNIRILEARLQRGEHGLAQEVERLRRELEITKAGQQVSVSDAPQATATSSPKADAATARAAVAQRAAELNAKQAPAPPVAAPRPIVPPPPPSFAGGVPYRIVPTPGQFAASTYDIDGPRLWIKSLHRGADKYVWGATEVRVVVKRDGVPLVIEHTGGAINAIRADLNNDGKVDRVPYSAVDPSVIDNLYIPMVGQRTKIELVYLVPTGKTVAVSGLPPTPLWGDPVRVEAWRPERIGRWVTNARTGRKIH